MPGKRPLALKRKRRTPRGGKGAPPENSNHMKGGAFVDLAPMIRDRRTRLYKFFAGRVTTLVEELGGPGQVSTARMLIIKRAAFKEIRCEIFENAYLNGQTTESEEGIYLAWTNSLRLDLQALGLDRVRPKVTFQSLLGRVTESITHPATQRPDESTIASQRTDLQEIPRVPVASSVAKDVTPARVESKHPAESNPVVPVQPEDKPVWECLNPRCGAVSNFEQGRCHDCDGKDFRRIPELPAPVVPVDDDADDPPEEPEADNPVCECTRCHAHFYELMDRCKWCESRVVRL